MKIIQQIKKLFQKSKPQRFVFPEPKNYDRLRLEKAVVAFNLKKRGGVR